jgi:hypothetical protein
MRLVWSCLIHAASWANAPRWGEGRSYPTTPIYAPKSLGDTCRSHHPRVCVWAFPPSLNSLLLADRRRSTSTS